MRRALIVAGGTAAVAAGGVVYAALRALAEWGEAENPAYWERPDPNEECIW